MVLQSTVDVVRRMQSRIPYPFGNWHRAAKWLFDVKCNAPRVQRISLTSHRSMCVGPSIRCSEGAGLLRVAAFRRFVTTKKPSPLVFLVALITSKLSLSI